MKRFLLSHVLVFYLGLATHYALAQEAGRITSIDVMGSGIITKNNTESARKKAISDSLVTAVEGVTSGLMPTGSLIQNFQTISEILYGRTSDYIQGYKVLTEARHGNVYTVLVQATVAVEKIEQQLTDAGIKLDQKPMPRVLFLITERNLGDEAPRYW